MEQSTMLQEEQTQKYRINALGLDQSEVLPNEFTTVTKEEFIKWSRDYRVSHHWLLEDTLEMQNCFLMCACSFKTVSRIAASARLLFKDLECDTDRRNTTAKLVAASLQAIKQLQSHSYELSGQTRDFFHQLETSISFPASKDRPCMMARACFKMPLDDSLVLSTSPKLPKSEASLVIEKRGSQRYQRLRNLTHYLQREIRSLYGTLVAIRKVTNEWLAEIDCEEVLICKDRSEHEVMRSMRIIQDLVISSQASVSSQRMRGCVERFIHITSMRNTWSEELDRILEGNDLQTEY